MPRIIRLRRHSLKPKDDTPTGLSLKGVQEAIKFGRGNPRRTVYSASVSKRAQSTAALLSQRGKQFGKQSPVKVIEGIGLEWLDNPAAGLMERATVMMEQRLKADPATKTTAADKSQTFFAGAWIDGWAKIATLTELIGPEPVFSDKKYQKDKYYGRQRFMRDHKAYMKMKKEYKDQLEGLPKSSDIAKRIVTSAILPQLPQREGVWKFFKKMLTPWKFLKRKPRQAEVVSHSYNFESVIQYLTGINVLTEPGFPKGPRGNQLVNELEFMEFKVSRLGKVTLSFRGKHWDVTNQIRALQQQAKSAA